MVKAIELENLDDKFRVTFEIEKSIYGDTFKTGIDYLIFPQEEISVESKIVKRGKEESTMYMLIPKEIKEQLNLKSQNNNILCSIGKVDDETFIVKLNRPKLK